MSTAALREPAGMRPVALDILERQGGPHVVTALLMVLLGAYLQARSASIPYELAAAFLVPFAVFLPAWQELGAGQQPARDAAMPMDRARFALIRLACGTVLAAFLLAVGVGLHTALFREPGMPGWCPPALFAAGLTWYFLGSAAVLRAGNDARATVCCCVLVILYLTIRPGPVRPLDPVDVEGMRMPEVLARAALPLGLAAAAAYAAARFPAPAAPAAVHAPTSRQAPARALPDRSAPPAVSRGGPARPTDALTVFGRHFALLRRFVIVPALTLLVYAVLVLMLLATGPYEEAEGWTVPSFLEATGLQGWCVWIALSWAVLVQLGEPGPMRRWNDTLPVGTAKRRVLHAAAGAAWLLLFLAFVGAVPLGGAAAGVLSSPADVPPWLWLRLPAWTLTLYFATTFILFGIPLAWRVFAPAALFLAGPALGLVMSQVQAGAGIAGPVRWSYAAGAFRLVLYGAAAAGAIILRDWLDRHGRLPTVREVRDALQRRAGTPPVPVD